MTPLSLSLVMETRADAQQNAFRSSVHKYTNGRGKEKRKTEVEREEIVDAEGVV